MNERTWKYYAWGGLNIAILLFIVGYIFMSERSFKAADNQSVRGNNGVDTVYKNDSAYVIHYKIDTAWKEEPEYEPKERN